METLASRVIERCEEIPADPAPGNYVVVDVIFFSTTVVELFENDAASLRVVDEKPQTLEHKAENPDVCAGGNRTEEYEAAGDYDFFNSPSFVQTLDVEDRPVAMTSTNGGRAINALLATDPDPDPDDVDVFVGSTTNAAALARHLRARDDDRPTYLVSSGTRGDVATEDHIGATLVGRHLEGHPPTEVEREIFRQHLPTAKGEAYLANAHPTRRRDLTEYITAFSERTAVPKLEDGAFVDVSDRLATAAAAKN
ncbi:2-phosphosulfolactate phosphatase [Halogranum amylolyticum]|uniref:2-phosphosulfolactate phosphatase n=1 Tax=Halogranum amylolyticum TaxID=660520 RepID=A0A1H8QE24_9EURY|nr:2-phosphosulfolactate phosphatase [Halogranum amylolyticum]SEO52485.1 2-phosphosulfolactate phosphatase [Halogranum amylolyticum]